MAASLMAAVRLDRQVTLNYWKQPLSAVPAEVWTTPDLEALVLADTGLAHVPDAIGSLASLRMLDLGHNTIAALPETIGDLAGLTDFLYVHDNRLTRLPDAIARLARLQYLNAGDNQLTALPEQIGGMANLVELRVERNALTSLPASIGRLAALRELHAGGNGLEALPDAIGDLANLRALTLRGNKLRRLPASMARLSRLHTLDLRGTPLRRLAGRDRRPAGAREARPAMGGPAASAAVGLDAARTGLPRLRVTRLGRRLRTPARPSHSSQNRQFHRCGDTGEVGILHRHRHVSMEESNCASRPPSSDVCVSVFRDHWDRDGPGDADSHWPGHHSRRR